MDSILIEKIIELFGLKPGTIVLGILIFYLFKLIYKKYKEYKKEARKEIKVAYYRVKEENNAFKNAVTVLSNENSNLKKENDLLKEKVIKLELELKQIKDLESKGGN